MGRIWLCHEKTAEIPFFVESRKVHLYSLEELCYYLYLNMEQVEESFFEESLFGWLERELHLEQLAEQLRMGNAEGRHRFWCVEQILGASGYYSEEELRSLHRMAEEIASQSPAERCKGKADQMLAEGRYKRAVWEYQKLLKLPELSENADMKGRIWHNMGTAYARQLLFEAAAGCYKQAYETGKQEESRKEYLLSLSWAKGQESWEISPEAECFRQQLEEKKRSGSRLGYDKLISDTLETMRRTYRKSE